MRFLLLVVFCLFSLPANAVTVTSDVFTGPFDFHVFGDIPTPIEIPTHFFATATSFHNFGDGFVVDVTIGTHTGSFNGFIARCQGVGLCNNQDLAGTFTLSDDDRDIHVSIGFDSFGTGVTLIDAVASFNLPDGLSIAAPVPEPATWIMMLIGFAGVSIMAYRRKSKPALLAA